MRVWAQRYVPFHVTRLYWMCWEAKTYKVQFGWCDQRTNVNFWWNLTIYEQCDSLKLNDINVMWLYEYQGVTLRLTVTKVGYFAIWNRLLIRTAYMSMSLAKNTLIYLLSNITYAAIPFFLIPILTRYLSPYEYGQITMFQMLVTAFSAFVGINTVGAATRNIMTETKFACQNIMAHASRYYFFLFLLYYHWLFSPILGLRLTFQSQNTGLFLL